MATRATPLPLNKPIVLIGMMGSGKSTVGQALAAQTQLPFVDLDTRIVKAEGMSIAEIFEQYSEAYFREREEKTLADEMNSGDIKIIATGGGIVLSPANRALINKHSIAFYLSAPLTLLQKRLESERAHRPLLSDAKSLHAQLQQLQNERQAWYQQTAHHTLNIKEESPAAIAEQITQTIASLSTQA